MLADHPWFLLLLIQLQILILCGRDFCLQIIRISFLHHRWIRWPRRIFISIYVITPFSSATATWYGKVNTRIWLIIFCFPSLGGSRGLIWWGLECFTVLCTLWIKLWDYINKITKTHFVFCFLFTICFQIYQNRWRNGMNNS